MSSDEVVMRSSVSARMERGMVLEQSILMHNTCRNGSK